MLENKSLISGSTSMLILSLLSERDMYGYEIIETLNHRSNHIFDMKAGTLYPLLHSLELQEYLTSYENHDSIKPRKYYNITGKGRRYLKKLCEEWNEYTNVVNNVIGGITYGTI